MSLQAGGESSSTVVAKVLQPALPPGSPYLAFVAFIAFAFSGLWPKLSKLYSINYMSPLNEPRSLNPHLTPYQLVALLKTT